MKPFKSQRMKDIRRTLFIGSSTDGLPVAKAIRANLESLFKIEIWNEGVFELMRSTLDGLFIAGERFEFAILVLSPDDVIECDGEKMKAPRDNVVLELGFFLGVLGRERTFIVHEKSDGLKLPTEIAGVTCATYHRPPGDDFTEAVVQPCNRIRAKVEKLDAVELPVDEKMETMIDRTLQLVCRALSVPSSPEKAELRAFVFRKDESALVCSHFWAPYAVIEAVDVLKFEINAETEKEVAVVKAAMRKEVCAVQIKSLSTGLEGIQGAVESDLCFVLAAPILGPKGRVWGTVDFDTATPAGIKILNTAMSKALLLELGRYLYPILVK